VFDVHPDANPANPTPSGVANLRASLDAVRRTGAPDRMAVQRYDVQQPDGTWAVRYWAPRNTPVLGPDGAVAYLLHEVEDVTAHELERARGCEAVAGAAAAGQRADAALRASEARFRTVQDASPHGLVLLRPVRERGPDAGAAEPGRIVDFRIQYVNPAGARLTGRRADAMVGHTLLALFPTTRALGLFDAYVRVVETGVVWEDDVRYVADGLAAGYQLAAVRVGEGADAELVLLYADATARLAAEAERDRLLAALDAERQRLRAVVLHMPAPLALLEGPEHRFTLVNDAFRRVSGGGRDVTGLVPAEAFPELAGTGLFALHDRVYATGEAWAGPETLVRYDRDGTGVEDTWFDLRFEPVRDGAGRVTAILNFAVDVTEQVRARREVERLFAESEAARREAERANRAKADFLAVMSHELRTPLNAIGGYAQLMELGLQGPVTPEQVAALGRIQRGQQHLLGLINGVLNYAKLEAGRVEYHPADVPAAALVAEVAALVAPQARAKGLALEVVPCPPDLVARADPEKVRQVLLNVLSNAVKFTRGGGRVTLACAPAPGGGPGDRRAAFTVADTGRGIAADQLARVFEPFVQVDQRLTREAEGTGLGLAISRDLARGMGGDLAVESAPGVGSTFTLTLPAAER
jgi:signal transduction histidine kinase